MMERAIGTTFKVGKDVLIVQEEKKPRCENEHGEKCYFYDACFKAMPRLEKVGLCLAAFRTDGKHVIFIKK